MAATKSKADESQAGGQPTLEERKDKFYEDVEKAQDERPTTTPEQDREAERNKRPYREREEEAVIHPIGYPTSEAPLPQTQKSKEDQEVEDRLRAQQKQERAQQ
jgi:hypothetical protein